MGMLARGPSWGLGFGFRELEGQGPTPSFVQGSSSRSELPSYSLRASNLLDSNRTLLKNFRKRTHKRFYF